MNNRDEIGLLCGRTRLRCVCGSPAQSILQINGTHSFPFCGSTVCERAAAVIAWLGPQWVVKTGEAAIVAGEIAVRVVKP